MTSHINISKKYQKDLIKSLNIYADYNSIKSNLIIEKFNFKEPFIKACIGFLGNSNKFQIFVRDLYSNQLKKKYYFTSVDEIEIAKIFINLSNNKNKINFIFEKKINYFIKILFYKIMIFTINIIKIFIPRKVKSKKFHSFAFYIVEEQNNIRANKIDANKLKIKKFNIKSYLSNNYKPNYDNFFFNNFYFSKSKSLIIYKILISFFFIQQQILLYKKKVIVSFEGDHYDHEIIGLITKSLNLKSICIQTTGIFTNAPKAAFYNLQQTKYLVWGKHYKELFKKLSPNLKIQVVGNCFLSEHNNKRKKIGIFLQKNSFLHAKEFNEFNNFIKWCISEYKKNILIRLHPQAVNDYSNIFKNNINIEIHDPIEKDIGESLSKCFCIVTFFSSTIIEAISLGVVPVIYSKNFFLGSEFKKLNYNNIKIVSNKISGLKNAIKKLISNPKNSKKIGFILQSQFKKYIYCNDVRSLKKIKKILNNESK